MNINTLKTVTDILSAAITTLAIVVGGLWALRRYVFEKEGFPRIEFFVDADFVGIHQDEWVVEILGLLKNQGNVPHRIKGLSFSVRAILDSDPIQDGEEIRGQLIFPHKIKNESWRPTDTKSPMVLMPGISLRYSYQYHVPISADFLLIQGSLNYDEHGALEHRADKVVRVPKKGEIAINGS